MKNFIQKHYRIIWWIIIVIIFILLLVAVIQVYWYHKTEIAKKDMLLQEAKKPSKIEQIASNIDITKNEAEKQKQIQEKAKNKYELAIWKWRCLELNLVLEANKEKLEDCNNNLERFASYNLKK